MHYVRVCLNFPHSVIKVKTAACKYIHVTDILSVAVAVHLPSQLCFGSFGLEWMAGYLQSRQRLSWSDPQSVVECKAVMLEAFGFKEHCNPSKAFLKCACVGQHAEFKVSKLSLNIHDIYLRSIQLCCCIKSIYRGVIKKIRYMLCLHCYIIYT